VRTLPLERSPSEARKVTVAPKTLPSIVAADSTTGEVGCAVQSKYLARARRFYERKGWRAEGTRLDTVCGVDIEEALYRFVPDG
jgi:hypothetical protein